MERPDWTVVRRPGSPILFFIVTLMILAIGYSNDHNSCERGKGVRTGLNQIATYYQAQALRAEARAKIDPADLAVLDLKAEGAALDAARSLSVHQLDCSFPFPSTH